MSTHQTFADLDAANAHHHTEITLKCDMERDCATPATMIDEKGYIYCEHHGVHRRSWVACRKMNDSELLRLASGRTISWRERQYISTTDVIETADAARNRAIEWQDWFATTSMTYSELSEWQAYFTELAKRFPEIADELHENGII